VPENQASQLGKAKHEKASVPSNLHEKMKRKVNAITPKQQISAKID